VVEIEAFTPVSASVLPPPLSSFYTSPQALNDLSSIDSLYGLDGFGILGLVLLVLGKF
jgi:hypothetical protein